MKITIELDNEIDSQTQLNAVIRADDLATCIKEIKHYMKSRWEMCDDDSEAEKMIDKVHEIIDNIIGDINDYTE